MGPTKLFFKIMIYEIVTDSQRDYSFPRKSHQKAFTN